MPTAVVAAAPSSPDIFVYLYIDTCRWTLAYLVNVNHIHFRNTL